MPIGANAPDTVMPPATLEQKAELAVEATAHPTPATTDAVACASVLVLATIPTCHQSQISLTKNAKYLTVLLGPNANVSMPRKLTAAVRDE
jgi:hypothetical protein